MRTRCRISPVVMAAALLPALYGCSRPGQDAGASSASASGNELTVLLDAGYAGAWPGGLDPATSTTGRANLTLMNAVFGGLFQLTADADGSNARVAGVLARDYEVRDDGRTLVIHLRDGVRFTDGTPFDAEAVKFNIERDLTSPCTCAPTAWPWRREEPVTIPDPHTVVLHFTRPYGAVVNALPATNVNWIVSPTALAQIGEAQFRITPVGAGPFRIVSNQLSSKLVLERNPTYWQQGRPYLDKLVFQSIGGEQAAMQVLQAGDAQVYEGMTSTPLIEHAMQDAGLAVTQQPPTSPYVVQLNTAHPPFDDKRAREAIYYATDVEAIRTGLFRGWYPVSQSFTGPGGLFHHGTVPGYRGYDPARARAIVAELGGLHITLGTLRSFVAEQVTTALQSQWREAGIDVSIETHDFAVLIREFQVGKWDAMLQTAGSYDPEASGGVSFRFRSDQPFTGVHDPKLDALLLDAAASFDTHERDGLYLQAAHYISDNAYGPFLFAFASTQVFARDVSGPGLSTKIPAILVNTGIWWQDVRIAAR